MLAAILFDLDGTLVNSDPVHYEIWRDILTEFGITIDPDFYKARISGGQNAAIIADILPQLSQPESLELAERKEALYRERGHQLQALAGLERILEWTEAAGLQKAIVTNAPRANAHFMIEALQLTETFPWVILGEEAAQGKPDPAPYQLALNRLQITSEQAIAFEDSPSGIRSAVGAGIYTVGITSTHESKHLQSLGARWTINDFTDPKLWDWLPGLIA
ncbi:MAG: HAD-IA family hydrolase [Chloroflexaceae bacterium]|nr:HAD-IA family hydrolase [Chloroflexaceae bacterium]